MKTLETNRLLLRKFEKKDAEACFEYLSDKETCYLDGGYEPWVEKNDSFWKLMDLFETQDTRYMIVLKNENKVIGTIFLRKSLFRVVNSMEIGYIINPNYRKKGFMKEALNAVMDYLCTIDVELVTAKAYVKNEPSIKFLENFGFIKEGELVKSFRYPGRQPESLICYYYDIKIRKYKLILNKEVDVMIDRPIGSKHPKFNKLIYSINYGYISDIIGGDGECQDVYILGVNEPIKRFKGIVIAVVHRINDIEDKWVVCEEGKSYTKEEIENYIHFQEQYFQYELFV